MSVNEDLDFHANMIKWFLIGTLGCTENTEMTLYRYWNNHWQHVNKTMNTIEEGAHVYTSASLFVCFAPFSLIHNWQESSTVCSLCCFPLLWQVCSNKNFPRTREGTMKDWSSKSWQVEVVLEMRLLTGKLLETRRVPLLKCQEVVTTVMCQEVVTTAIATMKIENSEGSKGSWIITQK